jgi:hypothetical protein
MKRFGSWQGDRERMTEQFRDRLDGLVIGLTEQSGEPNFSRENRRRALWRATGDEIL